MGEIYLKRLPLIVFFSLMISACGSKQKTPDVYSSNPDSEITSQPMQVDDSALQLELSEDLRGLKGYWVAVDNAGFIVNFEDRFATLVDVATQSKYSFFSDSKKDHGRLLSFVSYTSCPSRTLNSIQLYVDKSPNGTPVGFTLQYDTENNNATTDFVRANGSSYDQLKNDIHRSKSCSL